VHIDTDPDPFSYLLGLMNGIVGDLLMSSSNDQYKGSAGKDVNLKFSMISRMLRASGVRFSC
jgi:hypothetical protein